MISTFSVESHKCKVIQKYPEAEIPYSDEKCQGPDDGFSVGVAE